MNLSGRSPSSREKRLDTLSAYLGETLRRYQQKASALQIHTGCRQGFEEVNLLRRIKPRLYVGIWAIAELSR
jgi:hypothetical protein